MKIRTAIIEHLPPKVIENAHQIITIIPIIRPLWILDYIGKIASSRKRGWETLVYRVAGLRRPRARRLHRMNSPTERARARVHWLLPPPAAPLPLPLPRAPLRPNRTQQIVPLAYAILRRAGRTVLPSARKREIPATRK